MTKILDYKVTKASSDDAWIARTYAEYLMNCAKYKSEFMDKVNALAADSDLDELYDQIEQNVLSSAQTIDNMVFNNLPSGVDPSSISRDSLTYISAATALVSTNNTFRAAVEQLETQLGIDYSIVLPSDFITDYYCAMSLDELICDSDSYQTLLNSKVSAFLTTARYNDATTFTLNGGFVNMKDLIKQVVIHSSVLNSQFELSATNCGDENIGTLTYTVEEFWSECKANLVSTLSWAQGFNTIGIENVSDRLNTFSANISSMVSDLSSSFASSVANVKSRISNSIISVRDFLDQAADQLGWKDLLDNKLVPEDTNVMEYTGASPLGDIDLSTARGVLEATGRTVVAAAYAAWQGVKKLAKKIWGKIRPYVMAITDNPYDIAKISNSENYTVDGWCFTMNKPYSFLLYDQDVPSFGADKYMALYNDTIDIIQAQSNKWVKMDNVFGEILLKPISTNPAQHITSEAQITTPLQINFEIQVKPKCVNWNTVCNYLGTKNDSFITPFTYVKSAGYSTSSDYGLIDIDATVQKLENLMQSNDLYLDINESESDIMMGFIVGAYCLMTLLRLQYIESVRPMMSGWDDDMYYQLVKRADANYYVNPLYIYEQSFNYNVIEQLNFNNYDFLRACSGFNNNGSSTSTQWSFDTLYYIGLDGSSHWGVQPLISPQDSSVSCFISDLAPLALINMLVVWRQKLNYPSDYAYFPYSSEQTDFSESRFKIKTDSDNINIANAFYNALTLVTLAILTITVVGAVCKISTNAIRSRARWKVGQYDARIWAGEKLSPLENWSYTRKTKKLSKLSAASSGLNSGTSVADMVTTMYTDYQARNTANTASNADLYNPDGIPALVSLSESNWTQYAKTYKALTGYESSFVI